MPIVLPHAGNPLWRQVQAYLATDTDPTYGIVPALGNGASSIYPNFQTDGPNSDRGKCPTPFLLVYSGGVKALDRQAREFRIIIEVHDDFDAGDTRWPGLLARLIRVVSQNQYRPTDDTLAKYTSGLYFEEQSPTNLPDQRYETNVVQVIFSCKGFDRTTGRGYNG